MDQESALGRQKVSSPRRPLTSYLFFASAACLLYIAGMHIAKSGIVAIASRNSGLGPWLQDSFQILWFGYSLQLVVMASVLVIAGWKPFSVPKAVSILCGLLPIPSGALLAYSNVYFHTSGLMYTRGDPGILALYNPSVVATVVLFISAILTLGGTLSSTPRASPPRPAQGDLAAR